MMPPCEDLRREIADPWILLTAAALVPSRIRLGTAITPVARRRPAKLAREVTTLGVTWWDERMPWDDRLERTEPLLHRIEQGPPRI